MGALIAAGAVMLGFALSQSSAEEPPGWIAMNDQVEAVLKSGEMEEEKTNDTDPSKEKSVETQGRAVNGEKAVTDKEPQAVQVKPGAAAPDAPAGNQEGAKQTGNEEADNSGKIDINRATADQLDALPGIGAAKAKAIIADREKNGPFKTTKDLLRVKGIGTKMLEKMNPLIVAGS
ncbi:ComEA family DNA-binding protein [Paenibacillus spongiae]|uniref:Helix-hairpin-helix domain-containing protein n=1 Tax=Paenibacillus spongiae TaxID=2909671 RepID=A0ABY5SDK8_9BACL|nr:helix-hairpin-helix domain-containing protein [Paenibacillus spongiae]UVI32047.1 helix-hairpin-helix domain-containing protein [Paenibacillus spongiae]